MTGPTAVSALIHAATMVKAGVFLVGRIGPLFFALASVGAFSVEQFFEVVAWVGAITALLLATQALVNPEIKSPCVFYRLTDWLHDDGTWHRWTFTQLR